MRFRESASLFLPLYDCGLAQSVNVPTLPRLLRPWVPPFLSKQRGPGSSQAFSDKSHVGRQYALTALPELSPSGDGHRTLNLRPQRHPRVLRPCTKRQSNVYVWFVFVFVSSFRLEVSSKIWIAKVWWLRMGLVMAPMATWDEQEDSDTQICSHNSLQTTSPSAFLVWFLFFGSLKKTSLLLLHLI